MGLLAANMRSLAEQGRDDEAPERKFLPSEWRRQNVRAKVIEFRAAKAEVRSATRSLRCEVPDVRAELLRFKAERADGG